MSEHLAVSTSSRSIHLTAHGRLHKADYEQLRPHLERFIAEHGEMRLLFDAGDLDGWTPAAMWEDTKVGVHHHDDLKRLACVTDSKFLAAMTKAASPLTHAEVRVFPTEDRAAALEWIDSD